MASSFFYIAAEPRDCNQDQGLTVRGDLEAPGRRGPRSLPDRFPVHTLQAGWSWAVITIEFTDKELPKVLAYRGILGRKKHCLLPTATHFSRENEDAALGEPRDCCCAAAGSQTPSTWLLPWPRVLSTAGRWQEHGWNRLGHGAAARLPPLHSTQGFPRKSAVLENCSVKQCPRRQIFNPSCCLDSTTRLGWALSKV